MFRRSPGFSHVLFLSVSLAVASFPAGALAQSGAVQDSTLNNLVHDRGYVTGELGTLGSIVERGRGPIDMILVSGFGVGASAFEGFMRRNMDRYHMIAVTLPGFEGTPAPPMPPEGTSYAVQTWTHAATEAVSQLIRDRNMNRPVLVGHFINGTQVVMRLAIEHPEQTRAVVLLAGTPRFEPVATTRYWPKDLTLERKVMQVDRYLAPLWFKTVTRTTWVNGNFTAADYSVTAATGKKFADLANNPPLPVLIRYLCEFHASDLWPVLPRLQAPLLLLQPSFTATARADTTRNYLQGYFEEPWRGRLTDRPATEVVFLDDAGIMVMEDQAAIVDRKIMDFLRPLAR